MASLLGSYDLVDMAHLGSKVKSVAYQAVVC